MRIGNGNHHFAGGKLVSYSRYTYSLVPRHPIFRARPIFRQGRRARAKNWMSGDETSIPMERGLCKSWTLDSGLDSWTGLWTGLWTEFWTEFWTEQLDVT